MSIQSKIDEKLDEWERKLIRKVVKPGDKPVPDTAKDKMMAAGLSAISGLALSTLGPMMFRRSIKPVWKRIPIKPAISITLGAGIAGGTAPSLINTISAERRGEVPVGTAENLIKERQTFEKNVGAATAAFPTFKKESGLLTTSLSGLGKLTKWTAGTATKGIGTGLKTPWWVKGKKSGLGIPERAWGLAVHGAAGFGVYKGIKALHSRRRLSGTNYATMLRNNILAGNVKPDELSQADLLAVRRLGMR